MCFVRCNEKVESVSTPDADRNSVMPPPFRFDTAEISSNSNLQDTAHYSAFMTPEGRQMRAPSLRIGPWGAKWEPRGGSERLKVHPLGPKALAIGSSRRKRKVTRGIFGTLGRPQAPLLRKV